MKLGSMLAIELVVNAAPLKRARTTVKNTAPNLGPAAEAAHIASGAYALGLGWCLEAAARADYERQREAVYDEPLDVEEAP